MIQWDYTLILKMLVFVLVILVEFILSNGSGFGMGGAQVGFPRGFGAHRTKGNQLLQVRFLAGRAFRSGVTRQHQGLKTMPAAPALVFINGHD